MSTIYFAEGEKKKLLDLIVNIPQKNCTLTDIHLTKVYHAVIAELYEHTNIAGDIIDIINEYMTDIMTITVNIVTKHTIYDCYHDNCTICGGYEAYIQILSKDFNVAFMTYQFNFIFVAKFEIYDDYESEIFLDTMYKSIHQNILKYKYTTLVNNNNYVFNPPKYDTIETNDIYDGLSIHSNYKVDSNVYLQDLFDCYMCTVYGIGDYFSNIENNGKSTYHNSGYGCTTRYKIMNHKMMRNLIVIHDLFKRTIQNGFNKILKIDL